MNAIITVVGSDKVGIIAKVSAFLAERNINILDISQTGRTPRVLTPKFGSVTGAGYAPCSGVKKKGLPWH